MTLDVLICVADGVLFDGVDYATRIEERLAAAGLTSARFDLTDDAAEPAVAPRRAYVYTGGETSVHSDVPWMRRAIATARERAVAARGPAVVGICLGSQILAEALRSDSITATHAIEVGLTPVSAPAGEGVEVVPSFHYQAITPSIADVSGVRILRRNDHTAVQAFSYGQRVFGCQYHPELSADDMTELLAYQREVIETWHGDVAAGHHSVREFGPALAADLFDRTVIRRIGATRGGSSG